MVATVTVTVTKEGKVLTATSQLPEDTEFNNKVTPPGNETPPPPGKTPPPKVDKPPKPLLPNTGEESTSGALAGFGTLLAGIALAVRRRKDEE